MPIPECAPPLSTSWVLKRQTHCFALAREDADSRVRRAAVGRISEVDVLGEIARTDPDEDVRSEAIRGLAGLAAETQDPTAHRRSCGSCSCSAA